MFRTSRVYNEEDHLYMQFIWYVMVCPIRYRAQLFTC